MADSAQRVRVALGGSSLIAGIGVCIFNKRRYLRRILLQCLTLDSLALALISVGIIAVAPNLVPVPSKVRGKKGAHGNPHANKRPKKFRRRQPNTHNEI